LPISRLPGWRMLADLITIERDIARLSPRPDELLCFQTFVSGLAGTRAGRRLGIPALVWIRGEGEYRPRRFGRKSCDHGASVRREAAPIAETRGAPD
jgi:hypothetical protein